MGSPNEPGPPRTSDAPGSAGGSNGAHEGAPVGGGPPSGDAPPWQRGAGRPAPRGQQPRSGDGPAQDGPRVGNTAGHSPGTDARLNRFISGGPAAAPSQGTSREQAPARDTVPQPDVPVPATRAERSESARPEVYASELPDLSGAPPRPARTKSAGERSPQESSGRTTTVTRAQAGRAQGPLRASMQIRRLDPWSVLKVSVVLSVALFFVWMIAVAFLYLVLGGMGVWSKLNSNVGDLLTSASGSGGELVSSGTIFGGAALIGLVNIVLLTAMATCGAFIYNLTTDLVGGIEVTLADRD